MRLFLLPISTRRTLIYCERVSPSLAPGATKPPLADRIITKSSAVWTGWEKAEKGWQKKVTEYGNALFRRIPFEEWGLKTLPPATKGKLEEVKSGKLGEFECLFPGKFLEEGRVGGGANVPNLPFFYLCFRAYSHYRAWYGGKFLEHLTRNNLIKQTSSPQLDAMYATGLIHPTRKASRGAEKPSEEDIERVSRVVAEQTQGDAEEVMVLQKWNGKLLAEAFDLPEMEVEIERAVEQVEKSIGEERKVREEKREVERRASEEKKEKDS
ncbi:hypothetical protein Q7P35_006177 [Cladosporium inversicolor]